MRLARDHARATQQPGPLLQDGTAVLGKKQPTVIQAKRMNSAAEKQRRKKMKIDAMFARATKDVKVYMCQFPGQSKLLSMLRKMHEMVNRTKYSEHTVKRWIECNIKRQARKAYDDPDVRAVIDICRDQHIEYVYDALPTIKDGKIDWESAVADDDMDKYGVFLHPHSVFSFAATSFVDGGFDGRHFAKLVSQHLNKRITGGHDRVITAALDKKVNVETGWLGSREIYGPTLELDTKSKAVLEALLDKGVRHFWGGSQMSWWTLFDVGTDDYRGVLRSASGSGYAASPEALHSTLGAIKMDRRPNGRTGLAVTLLDSKTEDVAEDNRCQAFVRVAAKYAKSHDMEFDGMRAHTEIDFGVQPAGLEDGSCTFRTQLMAMLMKKSGIGTEELAEKWQYDTLSSRERDVLRSFEQRLYVASAYFPPALAYFWRGSH